MTREEFFKKLKDGCDSNQSYIVELLKLRGFLFEENTEKLVLSDNSHQSDFIYLGTLLRQYHLGEIVNNEIVIFDTDCAEFIRCEFSENKQIKAPSCWRNIDWRYFAKKNHGEKAEVLCLEPFIARYIKAISACCVLTVGSCDGNHPKRNQMYIITEGKGSIPWHQLICEKCLIDKFHIEWANSYASMHFTNETKYDTYYELNRAAEYLYANRRAIRRIKNQAFQGITNAYMKHHTSEEIEKVFITKASELFDALWLSSLE